MMSRIKGIGSRIFSSRCVGFDWTIGHISFESKLRTYSCQPFSVILLLDIYPEASVMAGRIFD